MERCTIRLKTGEDIEFITPAEYDERFGGDEDG